MSVLGGFTCFFVAVSIILAIATIVVRRKKGGATYFLLKCFASVTFVFTALLGFLDSQVPKNLAIFLIMGLIFGFLGDAVLGGKEIDQYASKKPFIIAGILAFLIGHVLFSVGFILFSGINTYVFVIPAVLAVVAFFAFVFMKYTVKGPMFFLLTIYAFLEVLMASSAGYLMMQTHNIGHIIAFVGSILFCISDFVLSYVYFGPDKHFQKIMVSIELTAYYSAQILISTSLLFM